jgi:hypothetical protein
MINILRSRPHNPMPKSGLPIPSFALFIDFNFLGVKKILRVMVMVMVRVAARVRVIVRVRVTGKGYG